MWIRHVLIVDEIHRYSVDAQGELNQSIGPPDPQAASNQPPFVIPGERTARSAGSDDPGPIESFRQRTMGPGSRYAGLASGSTWPG